MQDTPSSVIEVDLAAFDTSGDPVLLVEIKARPGAIGMALDHMTRIADRLQPGGASGIYWMAVDLDRILILTNLGDQGFVPRFEASTTDILRFYDDNLDQKRVFRDYLTSLVNAWINDLTYRWKSAEPPGLGELTEIGLVERLRGGETYREVTFARGDFICRNKFFDESLLGP